MHAARILWTSIPMLACLLTQTQAEESRPQITLNVVPSVMKLRGAAGILGRLYRGTKDTYQSWSPRAQIDGNRYVDTINKVRQFFAMGALF